MKKTYQLYAPWITALLIALTPFLLSSDIFHNKKEEKEEREGSREKRHKRNLKRKNNEKYTKKFSKIRILWYNKFNDI